MNNSFKPDAVTVEAIADSYFDEFSNSAGERPRAVIIMGGPATGKTTLRRAKFPTGYVILDAGEIFLGLCQGQYFDFPGPFEDAVNAIGQSVVRRIFSERRNFLVEIIGADANLCKALMAALHNSQYSVEASLVTCDIEVASQRNESREDDNISAYYAEAYHFRWILNVLGTRMLEASDTK